MPASMMSAASGSSPKVIGSSMAMVGIGPMPGSTPIKVPSKQPISAKPRLLQDAAAANPVARFWMTSTSAAPQHRQRLAERVDEHADDEDRHGERQRDQFFEACAATRVAGGEDERRRGDGDAEPL